MNDQMPDAIRDGAEKAAEAVEDGEADASEPAKIPEEAPRDVAERPGETPRSTKSMRTRSLTNGERSRFPAATRPRTIDRAAARGCRQCREFASRVPGEPREAPGALIVLKP